VLAAQWRDFDRIAPPKVETSGSALERGVMCDQRPRHQLNSLPALSDGGQQ